MRPHLLPILFSRRPWRLQDIFKNGAVDGDWLDPSDLSKQFQNIDGTGAVTTHGDPVLSVRSASGSGRLYTVSDPAHPIIYQTDGIVRWWRGDNIAAMLASITAQDARGKTMIASVLYEDVSNDTSNVVLGMGNSGTNTPHFEVGDFNSAWRGGIRSDGNTARTVDGNDNSSEAGNGRVLQVTATSTGVTLYVDETSYTTTASVGATTVNQVGLFCLPQTTIGGQAKARFFGGIWINSISASDAAQVRAALKAKQYYYWNFDDFDASNIAVPASPWALLRATGGSAWLLEALGLTTSSSAVTDTVTDSDLGAPYGTTRFSAVADPLDASKRAIKFVLNRNDADTGGVNKKRIEFSFNQAGHTPPYNSRTIWAYKFMIGEDWSGVNDPGYVYDPEANPATGDYTIIMQVHAGDGVPARPMFTANVFDTTMFFDARYEVGAEVAILFPQTVQVTPGVWHSLMGVIVPDFDGTHGGMLRVWYDGQAVVDYAGKIGFDTSAYGSVNGYFKCGLYKPLADNQIWTRKLTRSIYVKGFETFTHPTMSPQTLLDAINRL